MRKNASKYTTKSHVQDKAKKKIIRELVERIKQIHYRPTVENVNLFNSTVLGIHNYYRKATMVSIDFADISYIVSRYLYNKTHNIRAETGNKNPVYSKCYGRYRFREWYIASTILFPIAGICYDKTLSFSQEICRYTEIGRSKLHEKLALDISILQYLICNPIKGKSVEYNDNRISLYAGQLGRCHITKQKLIPGNMEAHHIKPLILGGTDEYKNLVFVTKEIHILIHATSEDTINDYLKLVNLDSCGLMKLNKLRISVGNCVIK